MDPPPHNSILNEINLIRSKMLEKTSLLECVHDIQCQVTLQIELEDSNSINITFIGHLDFAHIPWWHSLTRSCLHLARGRGFKLLCATESDPKYFSEKISIL